jgi:4-amino-4-deoxy-L-arabinose transferase-like glycosyltransferase
MDRAMIRSGVQTASRRAVNHFATSPHIVPAVFALALALRVLSIIFIPIQPDSDALWYLQRAGEMAEGAGYQEAGHPTAFWPVGYPALLAASMAVFGPSLFGPILLNLTAVALKLWLILWFSRRLGLGEAIGRGAALLYAVYPAHIVYAGTAASEVTATAVTMGAMAVLVAARGRIGLSLLAGLIFGAATLMRPQTLLLAPLLIALMWLTLRDYGWRRALVSGVAAYGALMLVVLPWTARNAVVLGTPALVSTNGGIALQAGANPLANGGYFQVEKSPLWQHTGIDFRRRVQDQVEMDRRLKAMAIDWIRENPADWFLLGFRKVATLWGKDSDAFWSLDASHAHRKPVWTGVKAANQLYYLALLGLGALALSIAARAVWQRDMRVAPLLIIGAMPFFCTALAFGFTGQTRYHFPAMPFMCIAAAYAIARLSRLRRDTQKAALAG